MGKIMSCTEDRLIYMYTTMQKIRQFEKNAADLFTQGQIPGFLHSYIGQEASATGVCAVLNQDDTITTTHRGHGHVIAKGADLNRMMAELFGKVTGYCKGKAGSMHIMDRDLGILGANGIVGGGIPIATGAALSSLLKKSGQVTACFFGDGASNEGSFHESINLASIWHLPVIYVCENNQFAESQRQTSHMNIKDIADRAVSYGIPSMIADGTDVFDVYEKAQKAREIVSAGNGPVLMEIKCYRWSGHYVGDPAVYRDREETRNWQTNRDPIKLFREAVVHAGAMSLDEMDRIDLEVASCLQEAIRFADESSYPDPESAMEDVFYDEPIVQRCRR